MTFPEKPRSIDIWIAKPSKTPFETYLKPTMSGLEFGSGCSTIWLAKRVKQLTSVEHSWAWFERVQRLCLEHDINNVNLIYGDRDNYLNILNDIPDNSLDFVFNDGLAELRTKCIKGAWHKIKTGGIMVIDNSEAWHSKQGIKYIENEGAIGTRYCGPVINPWTGRYNEKGVETSIWKK